MLNTSISVQAGVKCREAEMTYSLPRVADIPVPGQAMKLVITQIRLKTSQPSFRLFLITL